MILLIGFTLHASATSLTWVWFSDERRGNNVELKFDDRARLVLKACARAKLLSSSDEGLTRVIVTLEAAVLSLMILPNGSRTEKHIVALYGCMWCWLVQLCSVVDAVPCSVVRTLYSM